MKNDRTSRLLFPLRFVFAVRFARGESSKNHDPRCNKGEQMVSWSRTIGVAVACAFTVSNVSPALASLRIPSGEAVHAVLSSADINTRNAHVGDPFRMTLVPPYPGNHPSLAGGVLHGHVLEVRSGGQGRKARLKLGFDRLKLPNGESSPISASVQKLDKTPENTTARKALGAGAGAAVGSQTIGRILGGALGSVVGLVGGAAGGYLYGNNDKPNFNVAAGSQVILVTTSRALVERRQSR